MRSAPIPRNVEPYSWGEARVTYADWKGTAQVDERKTGQTLNEIVGLDYDQWLIVGLEFGGGEHAHSLSVLAVSREIVPEGGDVLPTIAAANGGTIPVTEFLIHDLDPYQVLRQISHMLDLRLRLARIADSNIPVHVVALGDVPEQSR